MSYNVPRVKKCRKELREEIEELKQQNKMLRAEREWYDQEYMRVLEEYERLASRRSKQKYVPVDMSKV